MEFHEEECLTLFDLHEAEANLQTNCEDFCLFDTDFASTQSNRGLVLPGNASQTPSNDLRKQCRLFMRMLTGAKKPRKKKKTNSNRKRETDRIEQTYQRIMAGFVRILPKPQMENGMVRLRTHPNEWSCILCGTRFADFNLFKLHHDSNKRPQCAALLWIGDKKSGSARLT